MTTRDIATSATMGFNPQLTLTRIELPVSGLPLKEHSTHLESTLRALEGVGEIKVNGTTGRLEVQYDAQKKVAITVKGGYTPDVIFVQKGRPVLLTFTWQESSACSEKVLFPDFNQNALLPEGVNRSHWNSRPRKQANTASNARWACCAAS